MPQIRQDILTGKMVIVSEERAKRPNDLKKIEATNKNSCYFCPGNEENTPPEIFRLECNNEWQVRVVPNKFPILSTEKLHNESQDFYNSYEGFGFHEVVIELRRHNGNFFNMTEDEFFKYLFVLKKRYNALKINPYVKYISIFKNYMKEAGASLEHPHSQILTTPILPHEIENEVNISKKYYDKNGVSIYDKVIDYERRYDKRIIHESENFIVIAPYASMYSNETMIICKKNIRFEQINEDYLKELSIIFKNLFCNLYKIMGQFPFNIYFHTHPVCIKETDYYSWHIHITPRICCQAGFELAAGIFVNSIMPEITAENIRW